ncbi:hypothetical protein DFH07DRAFT_775595 [Mycena maculata]|uniref:Uncharacterized protein n=1 Tax=Mycena maculata TaxID=230809 RepID=A0AAD7N7D6_9AGAR|nr:hypothetical protein DFH07DRAFT_775595 [Mycena maculata]
MVGPPRARPAAMGTHMKDSGGGTWMKGGGFRDGNGGGCRNGESGGHRDGNKTATERGDGGHRARGQRTQLGGGWTERQRRAQQAQGKHGKTAGITYPCDVHCTQATSQPLLPPASPPFLQSALSLVGPPCSQHACEKDPRRGGAGEAGRCTSTRGRVNCEADFLVDAQAVTGEGNTILRGANVERDVGMVKVAGGSGEGGGNPNREGTVTYWCKPRSSREVGKVETNRKGAVEQ